MSESIEGGNSRIEKNAENRFNLQQELIRVFKVQIQSFYVELSQVLNKMLNKENLPNLNQISNNILPIVSELTEIYNLLIHDQQDNIMLQSIQDFINVIINFDTLHPQENQGLRIRFEEIRIYLKELSLYMSQNSNKLKHLIDDMISIFDRIIKYLINIEEKSKIGQIKLNDVSKFSTDQKMTDQEMQNTIITNRKIFDIFNQYLTTININKNIDRVKDELKTIDTKDYKEKSLGLLLDQANNMENYYNKIQSDFTGKDKTVKYDPVLAQYMAHVQLKFQSCNYISTGISNHPSVNPRLFLYLRDFQGQQPLTTPPIPLVAQDLFEQNKAREPGEAEDQKHNQNVNYPRLLGITEELGYNQFKKEGTRFRNIPKTNMQQLPAAPLLLQNMKQMYRDGIQYLSTENLTQAYKYYDSRISNGHVFDFVGSSQDYFQIVVDVNDVNDVIVYPFENDNQLLTHLAQNPDLLNRLLGNYNLDSIGTDRQSIEYHVTRNIFLAHKTLLTTRQVDANMSVLCFDDEQLKEYLMPEVQIPLVQPMMKMTRMFNLVEQKDEQDHIQRMLDMYPNDSMRNWYNYLTHQQYGINTRMDLNQFDRDNIQQTLQNLEGVESDFTARSRPISSIFGYQQTTPLMKTDQGVYGIKLNQLIARNVGIIKQATEQLVWGLTDRLDIFKFYTHVKFQNADNQNILDDVLMNQNASFFNVDGSVCNPNQHPGLCTPNVCRAFDSKVNQMLQYHMYIAQNYQFFTLQGAHNVYDPLVRKKIFQVYNNIYFNQPVLMNLDRNYKSIHKQDVDLDVYLRNGIGTEWAINDLYLNTTRPLGLPQYIDDQMFIPIGLWNGNNNRQQTCASMLSNQPRISMNIILQLSQNNQTRSQLVSLCNKYAPGLVKNGVLRVDNNSISLLQSLLKSHDNDSLMRCYLSECIRIQYHMNFQIFTNLQPIQEEIKVDEQENNRQMSLFEDVLKKAVDIKKKGNSSVIALAKIVNESIENQLDHIVTKKGISHYKQIIEKLQYLIIHFKGFNTQRSRIIDFTAEEKAYLLNSNQYVTQYHTSELGRTNLKDNRNAMIGQGYTYTLEKYYSTMQNFLNNIQYKINDQNVIKNFVSVFKFICSSMNSEDKVKEDEFEYLIKNYIISQFVDINDSAMEFDFGVDLVNIEQEDANGLNINELRHKQLMIDISKTRNKTSLISIDNVYVPQKWIKRDPNDSSITMVVPQYKSAISQDFEYLFNQIINSMCQKVFNYIGMYRLFNKKVMDMPQFRLLMGTGAELVDGSGKRRRSKSIQEKSTQKIISYNSTTNTNIIDKNQITRRQYELYSRCILLCRYYYQLFQKINDKLAPEGEQDPDVLVFTFQQQNSSFYHLIQLAGPQQMITNEILKRIIKFVNSIYEKVQARTNADVYDAIISFINENYGITTINGRQKLNNMQTNYNQQNTPNLTNINQIIMLQKPQTQQYEFKEKEFQNLNKFLVNTKVTDSQTNKTHFHAEAIIKNTISELEQTIKITNNQFYIHNYINMQYDLLKQEQSSNDQIFNNLLQFVNNPDTSLFGNYKQILNFHESLHFQLKILDQNIAMFDLIRQVLHQNHDKQGLLNILNIVTELTSIVHDNNFVTIYVNQKNNQDMQGGNKSLEAYNIYKNIQLSDFLKQYVIMDVSKLKQKLEQLEQVITTNLQLVKQHNQWKNRSNDNKNTQNTTQQFNIIWKLHKFGQKYNNQFYTAENENGDLIEKIQGSIKTLKDVVFNADKYKEDDIYSLLYQFAGNNQKTNISFNNVFGGDAKLINMDANAKHDLYQGELSDISLDFENQVSKTKNITNDQQIASNTIKIASYEDEVTKILEKQKYLQDQKYTDLQYYLFAFADIKDPTKTNIQSNVQTYVNGLKKQKQFKDMSYCLVIQCKKKDGNKLFDHVVLTNQRLFNDLEEEVTKENGISAWIQAESAAKIQEQQQKQTINVNVQARFNGGLLGNNINTISAVNADLNNLKFKLLTNFGKSYKVYVVFDQDSNEIFQFNRILREMINNCQLDNDLQLFGLMLNGMWKDTNQIQLQFTQFHILNQELYKRRINEQYSDPQINAQFMSSRDVLQPHDVLMYENMLNNVLYDGFDQKRDMVRFIDLMIHNHKVQARNEVPELFTSSIIDYLCQYNALQQKEGDLQFYLQSMKNNSIQQQSLVAHVIWAKFNMYVLCEKMEHQYQIYERQAEILNNHLLQNIGVQEFNQQLVTIEIQKIKTRVNTMKVLQNFININVMPQFNQIIDYLQQAIPDVLQYKKDNNKYKSIYSNLYYLMDIVPYIDHLRDESTQPRDMLFKIVFSNYLNTMMNSTPQQLVETSKVLFLNIAQNETIARTCELIWYLVKGRVKLEMSGQVNLESRLAKQLLMCPILTHQAEDGANLGNLQIRQFINNHKEVSHDLELPHWLLIKSQFNNTRNEQSIPVNRLIRLEKYRLYLNHNNLIIQAIYDELDINLSQVYDQTNLTMYAYTNTSELQFRQIPAQAPAQAQAPAPARQGLNFLGINQINRINLTLGQYFDYIFEKSGLYDMYTIWDDVTANRRDKLIIQDVHNNLKNCLQQDNNNIVRDIVNFVIDNAREENPNVQLQNLRELGIVPLNIMMLKKDIGLVNLNIFSNTFDLFMNRIYTHQYPINQVDAYVNQGIQQLKNTNQPINLDQLMIGNDNTLRYVHLNTMNNILQQMYRNGVQQPVQQQSNLVGDRIIIDLEFKVSLQLYMIFIFALGGIVEGDTDTYMRDIEALIANPPIHRNLQQQLFNLDA